LSGEAALRSGDVTFEGYQPEPEPFDDDSEAVFVDVDTGEVIEPDELGQYELIDDWDLPPAA
jgi:hypothetical protein